MENVLIENNLPFAIYKLPGETEFHLILQKDNHVQTINNVENICRQKGFIFSPFIKSEQTPIISIRPDFYKKGTNEIIDFLTLFSTKQAISSKPASCENNTADDFEKYKTGFEIFHKSLTDSKFKKLVLSRILTVEKKTDFSAVEIFKRAVEKYPHAFIYLINTSQTGIWFGCSPEILLSGKNGEWRTEALAGTRKKTFSETEWDCKNIEEQGIVVDFIKEQFHLQKIDFKQGASHTVQAGNIEHCQVEFTFSLDSQEKAGILLKALHPTPAVSGYPKNEAIKFITENENHDRLYYSGFAGVVNICDSTDLFVNIRCMQILDNQLRLYAGGGLTASSNLSDEWLETASKLQTLLSLL